MSLRRPRPEITGDDTVSWNVREAAGDEDGLLPSWFHIPEWCIDNPLPAWYPRFPHTRVDERRELCPAERHYDPSESDDEVPNPYPMEWHANGNHHVMVPPAQGSTIRVWITHNDECESVVATMSGDVVNTIDVTLAPEVSGAILHFRYYEYDLHDSRLREPGTYNQRDPFSPFAIYEVFVTRYGFDNPTLPMTQTFEAVLDLQEKMTCVWKAGGVREREQPRPGRPVWFPQFPCERSDKIYLPTTRDTLHGDPSLPPVEWHEGGLHHTQVRPSPGSSIQVWVSYLDAHASRVEVIMGVDKILRIRMDLQHGRTYGNLWFRFYDADGKPCLERPNARPYVYFVHVDLEACLTRDKRCFRTEFTLERRDYLCST